jgi:hypothetical protein
MTLILGGLLGQNVALESLATFDSSARTDTKALFGAAFGFHLGH